jgi:hypothetical protein
MAEEVNVKAGWLTPLLHAADIEASIRFYELPGFTTIDTDRATPIGWARLNCEGGALMFLRAEEAFKVSTLPVLFYMYTPDLPALRERLLASGIEVPPIRYPGHMRSGEIGLKDPDGYRIEIGHWGDAEDEAWRKRIGSKP